MARATKKAAPAPAPKKSALAGVRKVCEKVLKNSNTEVVLNYDDFKEARPHISTGSLVLDNLIGGPPNKHGVVCCPGWPRGRISNIWGHESSGKTTVALTAAAWCGRMTHPDGRPFTTVFIDWENAIDPTYAEALGVPIMDPERFMLQQPVTLEDGFRTAMVAIKAGVDLLIFDSVGAGTPEATFGQSMEELGDQGRVGLLAQKWSTVLGRFQAEAAQTGTHIMGISQTRKKINTGGGGYGGPTDTWQGGEAWKFWPSVRLSFRRVKSEKAKQYDAITHKNIDRMSGSIVKAKVEKCKVGPTQQHESEFYIRFGEGIDDLRTIMDVAAAHGTVNKSGSWYTWERGNGETLKAQGADGMRTALLTTPGAFEELREVAYAALLSGVSIPEVQLEDEDDLDEIDALLSGGNTKKGGKGDEDEDEDDRDEDEDNGDEG
jgi:recombination protein RecA